MKTFRLIGMALIALCITACSDGEEEQDAPTPQKPDESTITIDASIITNGIAFTTIGGEKSISFNANTDWTLSIAPTTGGSTWCTASATSGSKGETTVKFTAAENTEYEDRSVAVTIKAGTASKTFTITQKCKDAMLLTSDKIEVSQKGGSIEVEVKANINYQMEISETAKSWITQTNTRALTARKHTFNIAANEDYDKREGEIYFINGEQKEVVKVYQSGSAVIMLTKNDYTVSDKGETVTVEIKSNFEYGVKMPDVDWISDVSTRGTSSHTLKYVVSPNETYDSRSAQIIYYDKNNTSVADTLTITQAQKDAIIISKKEQNVESKGGIIEVKLNTNIDFDIEMPQADWIKRVPDTRGLTEHTVQFTVSENTGNDSRSADIVFTNKNKQIKETVTVTQQAFIKTATVKVAGTLRKLLGDQYLKITALKVIGPLNGDDIYTIRYMGGSDDIGHSTKGKLSYLDLSDASIVEGGNYYYIGDYTSNDKIGEYMFYNCSQLKTITLPNSVTTIGEESFRSCTGLTSITIGNGVTTIGYRAFRNCTGLTSVTIGNGVTTIGDYAFSSTGLTSVTIPNSVTTIGYHAFSSCTGLTSITIPNSVTTIGKCAFGNCKGLTSATIIGSGVTTIGDDAFRGCTRLTSVTIGNGVTSIGYHAFSSCTGLTSVTIPNSVTTIGESAFSSCTGLTSVTIGNGVTSIGDYAFSSCTGLTSVTIGNGVTTIGDYAFSSTGLTSVTIPNSVTTIGYHAFSSCTGLTSVTIGNGITTIDSYAFSKCPINKCHIYATTPPQTSTDAFSDNTVYAESTLYVPKGCVEIYKKAGWETHFYNIVEMD